MARYRYGPGFQNRVETTLTLDGGSVLTMVQAVYADEADGSAVGTVITLDGEYTVVAVKAVPRRRWSVPLVQVQALGRPLDHGDLCELGIDPTAPYTIEHAVDKIVFEGYPLLDSDKALEILKPAYERARVR